MIDRWNWLTIGRACVSTGPRYHYSKASLNTQMPIRQSHSINSQLEYCRRELVENIKHLLAEVQERSEVGKGEGGGGGGGQLHLGHRQIQLQRNL